MMRSLAWATLALKSPPSGAMLSGSLRAGCMALSGSLRASSL
jgi:hypothetical protein